MSRTTSCALLLAFLIVSSVHTHASAQAIADRAAPAGRPQSGLGGIIVGWAGLGVGAGALAVIPLCYASFYPSEAKSTCVIAQGIFAGGAWVASAIGFSIGYPRRAAYRAWQARHKAAQSGFDVMATTGGAGLTYRLHF